jgi:hypothetical protein
MNIRTAIFACSLLSAFSVPRAAEEGSPEAYLESQRPDGARKRVFLGAVGLEFPVVGSQGIQPALSAFWDLPRSLLVGLKVRTDFGMAETGYDYIPQAAVHLRQLWLSDQDTATVRSSEYFSLGLGGYAAYDFRGERSGAKPFAAIILGKYWMPYENQPFGFDFGLEITRYFDGHPPFKERNHFLSVGVNLFRVL